MFSRWNEMCSKYHFNEELIVSSRADVESVTAPGTKLKYGGSYRENPTLALCNIQHTAERKPLIDCFRLPHSNTFFLEVYNSLIIHSINAGQILL
jgi:hypothetical protein